MTLNPPAVLTESSLARERFLANARKAADALPPRLHPQSWDALHALAKLHGTEALLAALRHIEEDC